MRPGTGSRAGEHGEEVRFLVALARYLLKRWRRLELGLPGEPFRIFASVSAGRIRRLNRKKCDDSHGRLCGRRRDHWLPARVFPRSVSRRQVATPTDYLKEFRRRSSLRFVQQRRRCPLNVCLFVFALTLHVKSK